MKLDIENMFKNLLEDLNSAPEIIDTDLIEKPKERRFKLFKKRRYPCFE